MLRSDHSEALRRGVKRRRKIRSSMLAVCPSIHPLHSASSSAWA
jgi:hypothetical protein